MQKTWYINYTELVINNGGKDKNSPTDLMVFKAAHVLVSSDTVGAEEAGTVAAASNCFLLRLAACAENPWCIYVGHIHCVHHHHVQRQLRHGTDACLLLATWTHEWHLFQLVPSGSHLTTTPDAHLCSSISITNFVVFDEAVETARTEHVQAAQDTWLLKSLLADLAEERIINISAVSGPTINGWQLLFHQFGQCTIAEGRRSTLGSISHLQQ